MYLRGEKACEKNIRLLDDDTCLERMARTLDMVKACHENITPVARFSVVCGNRSQKGTPARP